MNILEEEKIKKTIEVIPSASFTVLEFMKTFAEEFFCEWKKLVERYGLYGSKKRYTLPPISQIVSTRIHTNQAPFFARFVGSRKKEKVTTANLLSRREKNLEACG